MRKDVRLNLSRVRNRKAPQIAVFDVSKQPEVGEAAYDEGARMLTEFFHKCIRDFLTEELDPQGRAIIDVCLSGGSIDDYDQFTPEEARE